VLDAALDGLRYERRALPDLYHKGPVRLGWGGGVWLTVDSSGVCIWPCIAQEAML
jgi:hypothetical protein